MSTLIKQSLIKCSPVMDWLLLPFTLMSAFFLKGVRLFGVCRLPMVRKGLEAVGIFPLRYHYYENLFYKKDLQHPLTDKRNLPGVNLNEPEQLALLEQFDYQEELKAIPLTPSQDSYYYYANPFFEAGDSEMLYNLIRHLKPKRLFEIGCGYSTHLAQMAIKANAKQTDGYQCEHICIEPFEHPELESLDVKVIRSKVETMDPSFFKSLEANDILFIDSSHSIRPQGDVLFNIQQLLGQLAPGVYVHIHDIFTPRDYREGSLIESQIFWNEQYILEAFLAFNSNFKIVAANNLLFHDHQEAFIKACPNLTKQGVTPWDPCSLWIQRC